MTMKNTYQGFGKFTWRPRQVKLSNTNLKDSWNLSNQMNVIEVELFAAKEFLGTFKLGKGVASWTPPKGRKKNIRLDKFAAYLSQL